MTKRNGMPLEGEGSYIGAKKFQDAQRKFAESGKVETKAREAADALKGPEGAELEQARRRAAAGEIHVASKTSSTSKSFLDEAIINPETHFRSPEQVLSYAGLDESEKRRILEAWQSLENQLLESTEEGMGQPQPHEASVVKPRNSRLPEVQAALRKLDE